MKVHLAFNYQGINHEYNKMIWYKAVLTLGWQASSIEDADFTVMWGPNPEFKKTRELGKPVLMVDFPYWNRSSKIRDGREFYKVSLNGQHPTPYIMDEIHDSTRYIATNGPEIKPWRAEGKHILLAGMGMKAANQFGYGVAGWETHAVDVIRKRTDMPIIYRPKPGQQPIREIPGTVLDKGKAAIQEALEGAHAVVCHHGNPTVIALAMGVPVFMNGPIGVASHLASFEFDKIMQPYFPENRERFFNNIAHWQWSVEEITSGKAFLSYVARGFI